MYTKKLFLIALLMVVPVLRGQQQASSLHAAPSLSATPQLELQLNYNYYRANVVNSGNFSLNGGNVEAVFNLDRWWGLMGDFSAATTSEVLGTPQSLTLYNYHFGPRFSFRNRSRWTPYVQGLAGGSTISSNYPIYVNNPTTFGATVGGGLTVAVTPHFGLTLGEADWVYSRGTNGFNNAQNDLRLAAGIQLRFGRKEVRAVSSEVAPASVTCALRPATIDAGETVTATALNLDPRYTYVWTSTGGKVSDRNATAKIDTNGLHSGTYVVTIGHLAPDNTQIGDCTNQFTVAQGAPDIVVTSMIPNNEQEAALAKARAQAQAEKERALKAIHDRNELQEQLNSITSTRQTSRGLVVTFSDVLFDTGKFTLKPQAMVALVKITSFLHAYPDLTLRCEGYTDSVGGDSYNDELSERRAQAVKDFLVAHGTPASHITIKGFGKADPVASNNTPEGRARNRRVELVISGDEIGIPEKR